LACDNWSVDHLATAKIVFFDTGLVEKRSGLELMLTVGDSKTIIYAADQ
jgi:hypothetical protein